MKKRTYTITKGLNGGSRIVGRVEGPSSPAISTLWKNFSKKYNLPEDNGKPLVFFEKVVACKEAMELDGLGSYGLPVAQYFMNYLIQQCGFEKLPSDEFYVEL